MKAKISFKKSIFDDVVSSVTVYGQTRNDLINLVFALQKAEDYVVTNLFITDDEVKEKVESN